MSNIPPPCTNPLALKLLCITLNGRDEIFFFSCFFCFLNYKSRIPKRGKPKKLKKVKPKKNPCIVQYIHISFKRTREEGELETFLTSSFSDSTMPIDIPDGNYGLPVARSKIEGYKTIQMSFSIHISYSQESKLQQSNETAVSKSRNYIFSPPYIQNARQRFYIRFVRSLHCHRHPYPK